jgi:hypothetical protein
MRAVCAVEITGRFVRRAPDDLFDLRSEPDRENQNMCRSCHLLFLGASCAGQAVEFFGALPERRDYSAIIFPSQQFGALNWPQGPLPPTRTDKRGRYAGARYSLPPRDLRSRQATVQQHHASFRQRGIPARVAR